MKRTLVLLVLSGTWLVFPASLLSAVAQEPLAEKPKDDPAAHALYDNMIETMRQAETLSFKSHYRWEAKGQELGNCTYTAWLKKPNSFRLETARFDGSKGGILVGDGDNLWIYWPNGRPFSQFDDPHADPESLRKCYMKKPTPQGRHSIAHETVLLGAGMSMTILDASTFHGYTDSLQPYLDGVTSYGPETTEGEPCDVIEVSYMGGQRLWRLWLSQRDHLPRKLRQVVHVSYDIIAEEQWSEVKINDEIADELFVWKPPEDWKEWQLPAPEEQLLKPGEAAPDFELTLSDGKKLKLSDQRGKVVWLVFWRVG